jgi:plasmid stabilization system protein ParE
MTDLVIHPVAQLEYERATAWYAERSPEAARRFASAVEAAIDEVRKHPDGYGLVDDQHRLHLVHRFPYYVGYRYRPGLVEVVAIRHSSQDQEAWKSR